MVVDKPYAGAIVNIPSEWLSFTGGVIMPKPGV